jgi:hypothetical protein
MVLCPIHWLYSEAFSGIDDLIKRFYDIVNYDA